MAIRIGRIYDDEEEQPREGVRVLVDRLWPRGISKETARIARWMKEIAPSTDLRRWYGHDPAKWDEFRERYAAELSGHADLVEELLALAREGDVTLLFGSKERQLNNAAALKGYLEERL